MMGVGLFSVRFEVLHHVVLSNETLSASITGVRLFASVQAHVPSEVGLVVELLRTNLTFVGLLSGVLLQVLGVHDFVGKALAALVTFEGLVARVKTLVVLSQIAGLVEDLVALDAFVESVLGDVVGAGVGARHLVLLGDDFLELARLHFAHVRIELFLWRSLR